MEINSAEKIILALDQMGALFPEYVFDLENGRPVMVGSGSFSFVFAMHDKLHDEKKYVLKAIGFKEHVVTSERFWETTRLQYQLSQESKFVVRVVGACELQVLFDENGNIAQVYDADGIERWTEDGLHLQFILMERLEDIISRDRFGKVSFLNEELMNEAGALKLAFEIGQALMLAHENSILHRDIKLENIFWDGSQNCFKLGDFGIAKYTEGGNAETVVYTDGYGAPEIERHLNDYYTSAADIYSFGIVLYLLLNDLRFPGSEGYYPIEVQYDPDFIFPAPVNASAQMTHIIRSMTSFLPEERYQDIIEVLYDLNSLQEVSDAKLHDDDFDAADLETETYHEKKQSNSVKEMYREDSRATRKILQQENDREYNTGSAFIFIGLVLSMSVLLQGLQIENKMISDWRFWCLPLAVFFEAILIRIKDFHIFFGVVTAAFGVYSMLVIGVSVPQVLLLICLVTGIPILLASCAFACFLWMVVGLAGENPLISFFEEHDLSWIFIIISFILVYRLLMLRIRCEKTTYTRAYVGLFIYDIIFFVMIGAGILLLILQNNGVFVIPAVVNKLHLIRTGIISLGIYAVCEIVNRRLEVRYGSDSDLEEDEKEDDIHMDE